MPVPASVLWKPLSDAHYVMAALQPGGGGLRELFIRQATLREIQTVARRDPEHLLVGLLLGERLDCPTTSTPYVLVGSHTEIVLESVDAGALSDAVRALRERAASGPAEVLGWYCRGFSADAVVTQAISRVHQSVFAEPWQTVLVLGEGGSAGAFFLLDSRATQWFHAPFYEVTSEGLERQRPLSTCIAWPAYVTTTFVQQEPVAPLQPTLIPADTPPAIPDAPLVREKSEPPAPTPKVERREPLPSAGERATHLVRQALSGIVRLREERAAEAARRQAEADAARAREEARQAKLAAERRAAREETQRRAAEAAKRRAAEAEARRAAQAEADRLAAEEAERRRAAEAERRRLVEEQNERRRAAEAEIRRRAAEEEERRRAARVEAERIAAEAEARRKAEIAEAEARRKSEIAEAEARRRAEAEALEAKRRAEEAEAEAKRQAEAAEAERQREAEAAEARRIAEAEAERRAAEAARRRTAEEEQQRAAEAEALRISLEVAALRERLVGPPIEGTKSRRVPLADVRALDHEDTTGLEDPYRYIAIAKREGFEVSEKIERGTWDRPETVWLLHERESGLRLVVVTTDREVREASLHYNMHTDDVSLLEKTAPEQRDLESRTIYGREACLKHLRARCRQLRATGALEREWKVSPTI